MWLALALIVTLLTACALVDRNHTSDRAGSLSTKERKALHEQAREAARLSAARYLAIERPALERKLRQEHPTMTDADIDLLVDDALSKGLRQPPERSPDGPLRPPPMDCTSSPAGRPVSPNCY